jgi:hypothetical protein
MVELSPLILNGYLSRSYKILGPTVNPFPRRHRDCMTQMGRTKGAGNPFVRNPTGYPIFSKAVSKDRHILTINTGH